MQCVILAGGLGTRMRPLTDTCPKTLLPVAGRPFAYYQMHWLARQGVTDVVYSIGHHGKMIRSYWEREPSPVPWLRFVDEGDQLLGTGGAVRLACRQGVLQDRFFVIYGDSFLPVEFRPIWQAFESSAMPALMTVLRNRGQWDRSNVRYHEGRVLVYDKRGGDDFEYIDYGLSVLRRRLFENCETNPSDLATLFHELSVTNQLAGFQVSERFYEIGSPEGFSAFERYLEGEQFPVTP